MSAFDFRKFLEQQDKDGELLRVKSEIDTLDDIGAFISRLDYSGLKKSVLFENPKGFDIPVYANTVGHDPMSIARSFGVDGSGDGVLPNIAKKMGEVLQSGGIEPEVVGNDDALCKEIIMTGDEVDLSVLPITRCNPSDGQGASTFLEGRFITNLVVSHPVPEAHNLSYHRFEVTRKDGGSIWIYRGTGDALNMQDYWGSKIDDPEESYNPDAGKPFPIAYVFGVTPEFIVAGANKAMPFEGNDYSFIGGLRNEAVKMVKCETIDCYVPADAEIVVEGIMKPFNWTTQGAFASFNAMYDEPRRRPIFDVTAITMRKKPIYQHVHVGRPINETNTLAGFFRGVHVYREVKAVLPNLVDLYIDPAAGIGFTVHLSIRKGRIGEPKLAMMRAYTALQGFCKHVFVYDDDVDIQDPHERNWALAHRFLPSRDLMIIPNVIGMVLEPMAQGIVGKNSKLGVYDGHPEMPLNVRDFMGVDCTKPLGLSVMDRVLTVPEIEARVDELWKAEGIT
jgi:4-hydroxy-3-polyprenylbenzoate decarboxylase